MAGSLTFAPGPLRGELRVPGDKSISHRALTIAAAMPGPVRIAHVNPGRDVRATIDALLALGTRIEPDGPDLIVEGAPLREPAAPLDCANSGSTARMILGACAGAGVAVRLDGDASLRRRPMEPVAAQLRAFGAHIETTAGCLPLQLSHRSRIETRNFILLSPSAQVKSALLFAGLFAGVEVGIRGDRGSRDHTERLLRYVGADVAWDGRSVVLSPSPLHPKPIAVPGDVSSAAFFITAAAITPGSALVVRDAGVNPTRTGLLDVLTHMGARIERRNPRERCGEPIADLAVEYAPLRAVAVGPDLALRAIDEIPLVALAAAFADGETSVTGIRDLRVKESDRIAGIARLLEAAGIDLVRRPDGLSIRGGHPAALGRTVETHGDHRIAMAAAVLGCAAGPIAIDSSAGIDVSFPGFAEMLQSVRSALV